MTISQIAHRIEELEVQRNLILDGDFLDDEKKQVVIELFNNKPNEEEDIFFVDLTDCKKEVVQAVIDIINRKIKALTEQLIEELSPKPTIKGI